MSILRTACCFIAFCVVAGLRCAAAEAKPSGTLPVCYIETVDHTPIDQKETYIDATFYMEGVAGNEDDNAGTMEVPLPMGIRGRGNASWTQRDKKPYKIKFDSKTSLLGLPKNKHYALLTIPWYFYARYGNFVGLEISRDIGLQWTPSFKPVEVVLNGKFIGLYYLAETVRIDKNRLDIFEQPEDNLGEGPVDCGWLIEIDNYMDENQIRLKDGAGADMWFTVHTPEPMNELHQEWITSELLAITDELERDDVYSRRWEEYIDIDYVARYFVVQEVINNWDSFVGSTYFYKDDSDDAWRFGPLWDAGDFFVNEKTGWTALERKTKWIKPIAKYPRFWAKVKEVWRELDMAGRLDGYHLFFQELLDRIRESLIADSKVWPSIYGNRYSPDGEDEAAYQKLKEHVEWMESHMESDFITHRLDVGFNDELCSVTLNGNQYDSYDVFDGASVELEILPANGYGLGEVVLNGVNVTADVEDYKLRIENISTDLRLDVTTNFVTGIEDVDISGVDNRARIFNAVGQEVTVPNDGVAGLPSDIYIVVSSAGAKKIALP